jgi:hypothetical protein
VIVRDGKSIHTFLNGNHCHHDGSEDLASDSETFFFGGSCTGEGNFEGRLDEIAVFDRALSQEEIVELYRLGTAK